MAIIYPEGDWKHFKGTGRKPHLFMCKFCGQIEYFEDSESWTKHCVNCDHERWMGSNNFTPITLTTAANWLGTTTGWFKEELIAQLLDSSVKRHRSIGEVLYKFLFVEKRIKWK